MVGIATSFRRELMWCLATYAVRPGQQGRGIGQPLLAAALHHGRGCLRGDALVLVGPAAVRRYRPAGFDLHPQMFLSGTVDRTAIPVVEKVREGSAGDLDLMDSLDRRTRGAAHGAGPRAAAAACAGCWSPTRRPVAATPTSTERGHLALLAASNRRTARPAAVGGAGRRAPDETVVRHVTAANQWAIDVGFAARLDLHQARLPRRCAG